MAKSRSDLDPSLNCKWLVICIYTVWFVKAVLLHKKFHICAPSCGTISLMYPLFNEFDFGNFPIRSFYFNENPLFEFYCTKFSKHLYHWSSKGRKKCRIYFWWKVLIIGNLQECDTCSHGSVHGKHCTRFGEIRNQMIWLLHCCRHVTFFIIYVRQWREFVLSWM